MTPGAHLRSMLGLAAACLALAGCGSDDTGDPIPRGKAQTLNQQLDAIRSAVDAGNCDQVASAVSRLQTTIATLDGDGVGDDVQDALGDGADNLRSLASGECEPDEEPIETTPETVPETETETVPPPTETVPPPTETTPPPTTTTPTTPVEPPPDEGDGGEQFDPGGGGTGVPPGQEKKGEGDFD